MENAARSRNTRVVYTAIFAQRDEIKPAPRLEGYDCVLFTDGAGAAPPGYRVVRCPPAVDPRREARRHKMLAHVVLPRYEYSVWVDGSITICGADLDALIDRYLADHDIALHVHPERSCLYDEADACVRHGQDVPSVLAAQAARYAADGYPRQAGLVSSGILYRRHTPRVERFCGHWYDEIVRHSARDQVSFNYVAWKHRLAYFPIPGHVRLGTVGGFRYTKHMGSP